ncbi:MAG: hypothetical protein ACD_49C00050G0014 [uncultured bacterium (gcode 4)]|uniref:Lipoprotein n=1 Tax=uncultured bacterium (gcode 4) TaxID=1234023 RepID=K2BVR5_9BACT|nr:MAG: hypothetical protein ACD_49C00050G0014 [uncultured bacterium (gcode 4)]
MKKILIITLISLSPLLGGCFKKDIVAPEVQNTTQENIQTWSVWTNSWVAKEIENEYINNTWIKDNKKYNTEEIEQNWWFTIQIKDSTNKIVYKSNFTTTYWFDQNDMFFFECEESWEWDWKLNILDTLNFKIIKDLKWNNLIIKCWDYNKETDSFDYYIWTDLNSEWIKKTYHFRNNQKNTEKINESNNIDKTTLNPLKDWNLGEYFKIKNGKLYWYESTSNEWYELRNADINTFTPVEYEFAKDKNWWLYKGFRLSNVINNAKLISYGIWVDSVAKKAYCNDFENVLEIKWVDTNTFVTNDYTDYNSPKSICVGTLEGNSLGYEAHDKNHCYWNPGGGHEIVITGDRK